MGQCFAPSYFPKETLIYGTKGYHIDLEGNGEGEERPAKTEETEKEPEEARDQSRESDRDGVGRRRVSTESKEES